MSMIAAWMLFAMEISALLFVSAWIAERALLTMRRPVRGVWVTAIVAANLLPILLAKVPVSNGFVNKWSLTVAAESFFAKIDTPLLALWGFAVVVGTLVCASAVWRMARTRPQWKTEHVDNTPVLVSHDIGPALVGVMQYSIVVPQWTYSLEEGARKLLLTHEREHARKFDPLLLTAAALAVVIAPWNLFNWLFFRRLHLAVELDCDQRVLRTHPDTRNYGALLLDVAERVLPSVMPAAAFVEHGASLETRINAMSDKKKSFRSLRVATGLAASLMLAVAACFTPRPYAIIIVNPPAPAVATASTTPQEPKQARVEPERTTSAKSQDVPPEVLQYLKTAPVSRSVQGKGHSVDLYEIKPVRPSARTLALDAAEVAHMRALVLKLAPSSLGTWPRADSGMLMLFDESGEVAKQTAVPILRKQAGNSQYVFSATFAAPEVYGIESASEFTIERGARGELLQTPLTLYSAHLLAGLPVPKTIAEVTPSRGAMLATVRERHPEVLADTLESLQVSALLYDTKGKLLKSAIVTMENGEKFADGTYNNEYERQVWRKAFGAVMDSGTVMQNGTWSLLDGKPLHVGPTKIMYAMLLKRTESSAWQELAGNRPRRRNVAMSGQVSGSSSRAGAGLFDGNAMEARLRVLVHTQIPDAYGDWPRSDSAVVFLLDAEDQLVAVKKGLIPKNFQLRSLADYISLRVITVPADDIDRVGYTTRISSESGRVLDTPLAVIWGRLSAEATRKLRLPRH